MCGLLVVSTRRNVTPASFEGEGDRVTPRRMALRQFEIPLGSIPDKEGMCVCSVCTVYCVIDSFVCVAFVPRGLNKKQAQGPAGEYPST